MRRRLCHSPIAHRPWTWAVASGVAVAAFGLLAVVSADGGARTATQPASSAATSRAATQPITAAQGPLGNLLRKWWADGAAAGNEGDYYDNRDRGHSDLRLDPYPQLRKIQYSPEERARYLDWALQTRVLPQVVFGNSSTSAGPTTGGSNPRSAYSHAMGLQLLYKQYRGNNLYIYPEHRDHDPGHNGSPDGYGDLFPTNTPYVIISQGSSGSDQPFMRAMPHVLAAFRPEVKRKLIETGLLMPTVQMILRRTIKPAPHLQDYITGKAHPTVFEGAWVDELRMVETAHSITLQEIPPMVQLRVTEEDQSTPGRDFFDARSDQRLGDTPAVIARIFRTCRPAYRMVVTAEGSFDVNKRPLKFHWVVLRGDASRIRLKPLNESGSVCEIVAPWQPRMPIAPGSPMESTRIDVGVFVHNGAHYSAPGFITFFCLDDEARTYDADDRLLEIGYGLGATEVSVADWCGLLDLYKEDANSPGARLLRKGLSKQAASVLEAGGEYRKALPVAEKAQQAGKQADEALAKAKEALKAIEDRRKKAASAPIATASAPSRPAEAELQDAQERVRKAEADAAEARKAAQNSRKAAEEILTRKRDPLKGSVKELVEGALRDLARSPAFYSDHKEDIAGLAAGEAGRRSALDAARKRLIGFGLLKEAPGEAWELTPLREGKTPVADRLTRYERALLEQSHGEILSRLFYKGLVDVSYKRDYVDPRIGLPKTWRDVYRYSPKGDCIGWARYGSAGRTEFNASGLMVLEKDALGRCVKAQAVRYVADVAAKGPTAMWGAVLKQVPDSSVVEYEYAGEGDWLGKTKRSSTTAP